MPRHDAPNGPQPLDEKQRAARGRMVFVQKQLEAQGLAYPLKWRHGFSAGRTDDETRLMINWAKARGVAVELPEGFQL